jgi:hypothetical protein
MARLALSFVDRLVERGLVDRFGFLCFAFAGAALIVLAKAMGVPAVLVAVFAAAAIVAYAILVQRTGTGRLRSDQAGDNCYYLGLIYTLASLAYAIFTFDPADTATTIIQGFGVALATTIIGLVLRVYFNQSRPDLAESETTARLELAAASGKLKAELSRSVVSMNDFSRQTRQSLEELRDEILASLQTVREGAERSVQAMAQQATSAVSDNSEAAVTRTKKLSTAAEKVVTGMESHAAALTRLEGVQSQITASLGGVESAALRSQAILENLVTQSNSISQLQAGASETVRGLAGAASLLNQHVEGLAASSGRLEGVLIDKLAEVQAVPRAVADGAVNGINEALERVRVDLQSIVEAQARVSADLSEQVRKGVDLASRHNGALELEVARSRENVAKVHTALVDMTEQLAARVEAAAE